MKTRCKASRLILYSSHMDNTTTPVRFYYSSKNLICKASYYTLCTELFSLLHTLLSMGMYYFTKKADTKTLLWIKWILVLVIIYTHHDVFFLKHYLTCCILLCCYNWYFISRLDVILFFQASTINAEVIDVKISQNHQPHIYPTSTCLRIEWRYA